MSGGTSSTNQSETSTGHEGHDMSSMQIQNKHDFKSEHAMINVQGLCEMCKERIEKAAKGVNGVTSTSWDQKTKQLHLNFDPSKPMRMLSAKQ